MRWIIAVCAAASCPTVVLTDDSAFPDKQDVFAPAVEEVRDYELEFYGFGGIQFAKPAIALGSPFRAKAQLGRGSVVFRGTLKRISSNKFQLDLTVEEHFGDGTAQQASYRKELQLDKPEDLAVMVYYGVTLHRYK